MKYQDSIEAVALEKYAAAMNARAKRYGAPGKLTASLLRDRIMESGGRCEWCGADLLDSDFELDHAVSLRQAAATTVAIWQLHARPAIGAKRKSTRRDSRRRCLWKPVRRRH